VGGLVARYARFAGGWLAVAEAAERGPLQVAIVGEGPAGRLAEPGVDGVAERATDRLAEVARRRAPGGAVVVVGEPDAPGVPLLADRPAVGGAPTAYVCRGFVCDRPRTDADDLAEALAR
jgi:uncharacterized protein